MKTGSWGGAGWREVVVVEGGWGGGGGVCGGIFVRLGPGGLGFTKERREEKYRLGLASEGEKKKSREKDSTSRDPRMKASTSAERCNSTLEIPSKQSFSRF